MSVNPLILNFNTYKKSVPFNEIKTEHYIPAFEKAISLARDEINTIINNPAVPNFDNTVVALERSGKLLNRLQAILFNINAAETSKEIQKIAQEVSPKITDFVNDIMLNEELFSKIKKVFAEIENLGLNEEQQKLLKDSYKRFVRRGANLSRERKDRFRTVSRELSKLTLQFGENVLADTNVYFLHITEAEDLSGLPEYVMEAAAREAESRNMEGWVFTLKFPSFAPFLKYADNRSLRETIFKAFHSRGSKKNENNNENIIKRIVELRIELAKLLGYSSYAHYILEDRMAETPENVTGFINELLEASIPVARAELEELQNFVADYDSGLQLQRWDWDYYSEKLKKAKFDFNDEMVKPYFSLNNVKEGIFDLVFKLYGIKFTRRNDVPVYHPDVTVYQAVDEDGKYLGLVYLDFFPREGKQGGAWMTSYLDQYIDENDENIRPHISLVFNFTKPTPSKPSLLTFYEVTTFLHEFGHGLHGLLTNCSYQSLSGTSVYRDFVELPSQIMENWALEHDWLNQVAIHYDSRDKMPEELLKKIIDSKNYHNGYAFVRQLGFALNDMAWHLLEKPTGESIHSFEQKAMAPANLLPEIKGCLVSPAFSHIFSGGYAAGYYGYKWAEVLDADAFSVFLENGIFDKKTASSFRKNILEKGGTEHPMELYLKFRGQKPSVEPLLKRSGLK
ncbi:MAG: M3 family metallopeptidase [Bacteroidales bacterium]|nr:M3 family metallopeptidase [Bacteroidales bacterium]